MAQVTTEMAVCMTYIGTSRILVHLTTLAPKIFYQKDAHPR